MNQFNLSPPKTHTSRVRFARMILICSWLFVGLLCATAFARPSKPPLLSRTRPSVIYLKPKTLPTPPATQAIEQPSLTEHLKHYAPIWSPLTQGIEIEGLMPRDASLTRLVPYIQNQLQRHYKNIKFLKPAKSRPYIKKINFTKNHRLHTKHTYTLHREISNHAPRGFYAIELASPILKNKKDVHVFLSVLKALKQQGFIASPLGGGTHVHIGFPYPQAHELALLFCTFMAIEKAAYKKFNFMYTRYIYSMLSNENHRRACFKASKNLDSAFNQNPHQQAIDFDSLNIHKTVEFRFANSTTSPQHIQYFLQFATQLVQAVRLQKQDFVDFLHQNSSLITRAVLEGTGQDYLFDELTKALHINTKLNQTWHQDLQNFAHHALNISDIVSQNQDLRYFAQHAFKPPTVRAIENNSAEANELVFKGTNKIRKAELDHPFENGARLIPKLLQISNIKNKNKMQKYILKLTTGIPVAVAMLLEHAHQQKQLPEAWQLLENVNFNMQARSHATNDLGGLTPFLLASSRNLYHATYSLLEKGADVNAVEDNKFQRSALILHIHQQRPTSPKMVKLLIEYGININYTDSTGYTALMWAVHLNDIQIAEILLNQPDIRIDIKGHNGHTAESIARKHKKTQLLKMIEKYKKHNCQQILTTSL